MPLCLKKKKKKKKCHGDNLEKVAQEPPGIV